jgi:lysophospholipase L1-like esterase/type 1 glutamine amidotransferase
MPGQTGNKMIFALLGLLLLAGCGDERLDPLTVHLVGDSTMANKPDPERNPERGWGQMLQGFFIDRVTVKNHAVNGRSTKSFIDEGKWNRVVDEINPGDYVFIQFGHNDQKAYDPSRYTNPYSAYRRNLEKMVRETREKGGNPVLLSSIVRRHFNEEGTLVDTHGPYPFVARLVARKNKVPFIDLQQMTGDLVSGLGPARSADLYMILKPGQYEKYPEGRTDNTHLNVRGATEVAGMVARSIRELDLPLSEYLDPAALRPRLLVVVGGHSYDTTEFVDMFRSMEEFRFDTIYHPHARSLMASDYISSYDAIVFYDFMKELPLKDSTIYLNLAHRGMPLIFLHHSICSFQQWEGYKEIVGGKYVVDTYAADSSSASNYRHDLDLSIKILDPGHPVTRGMDDFMIHDEGYSNLWIRDGIKPLLGTDHPDCSDIVGWVNHFDRSTCVYIMFGHDRQAYGNKSFRQLLRNSAAWLTEDK